MDVHLRASNRPRLEPPWSLATARPRLSVVIVNYLRWQDTARLVRQLRASSAFRTGRAEVVIVDNHSPPHPVISRLRRTPGVSLRRWRGNRGFARAVNEGCRLSRGEWLLLLNPDMTAPADFLDQVLRRADDLAASDPQAGIVGFRLVNCDGTPQLSTGPFPTLAGSLARLLLPRYCRKYAVPAQPGRAPVDWVTGCCLLVRRDCWTDLGGFDPDFFLYYEDVDLCRRARSRGWSVWYDPSAGIVHHHPLHARAVPPHLRLITRHALITYARKHWASWQLRALGGIVRLETWARRLRAWWNGETDTGRTFQTLDQIVAALVAGDVSRARALLREVVDEHEVQRGAVAVHRHSRPPAARPAHGVPGERHTARAAQHTGRGGR